MDLSPYPTLKKALVDVAHDCGFVGTNATEEAALEDAKVVLAERYSGHDFLRVETYLKTLSPDKFTEICIGSAKSTNTSSEDEKFIHAVLDAAAAGMGGE